MIHRKKNYLLYKVATCVLQVLLFRAFSYRPSSIRTLLRSVQDSVLFSILQGSVLLRAVFVGLFFELTGLFKAFFFGLLQPSYCC